MIYAPLLYIAIRRSKRNAKTVDEKNRLKVLPRVEVQPNTSDVIAPSERAFDFLPGLESFR